MNVRVGARVRDIRTLRRLTLEDVSARTGISRSTLSRLENDQRRPSLELLLPLAATYRVSLDDLVSAPESGDRRLRPRPRRVKGRAVVPLTDDPHGVQAWKIVIPAALREPRLRSHDGREWLYVLSGELRLVLAEQDLVLGSGEVADFRTTTPHWFGSTGAGDVEILSLYGRAGERQHLRAVVPSAGVCE
jgi:transcriptional regulator with XRE-family HTH domain